MMTIREDINKMQIMLHKSGVYSMSVMHIHDAFEIFITEESDRSYMLEDKLIHLRPRDVLLINRNKAHYAFGGYGTGTVIEFPEAYVKSFFTDTAMNAVMTCFEKSVIRVRQGDFPTLLSLAEKLYEDPNDFLAFGGLLTVLKNNMSRNTYDLQSSKSRGSDILDYITENYMTIESLDEVAGRFYISSEYLCRIFKNHTGTSIIKYINVLKIHYSLNLMANKELTLTEIAKESGYDTLSNFSKNFRGVMGVYPSEYRKSLQNEEK